MHSFSIPTDFAQFCINVGAQNRFPWKKMFVKKLLSRLKYEYDYEREWAVSPNATQVQRTICPLVQIAFVMPWVQWAAEKSVGAQNRLR